MYLFIVNNDVLVPRGVLTKLMHAMREDGAALAVAMNAPQAPP
jgi:GT2 family glycosyltransferase